MGEPCGTVVGVPAGWVDGLRCPDHGRCGVQLAGAWQFDQDDANDAEEVARFRCLGHLHTVRTVVLAQDGDVLPVGGAEWISRDEDL